jgi:hypothetical protein
MQQRIEELKWKKIKNVRCSYFVSHLRSYISFKSDRGPVLNPTIYSGSWEQVVYNVKFLRLNNHIIFFCCKVTLLLKVLNDWDKHFTPSLENHMGEDLFSTANIHVSYGLWHRFSYKWGPKKQYITIIILINKGSKIRDLS